MICCVVLTSQVVWCVQKPLKPLHEFIHTLGPMPPLSHLHTYISRMKEQGWNVWRIVKKALDTGHLEADLCSLLQMPVRSSASVPVPIPGLCINLTFLVHGAMHT